MYTEYYGLSRKPFQLSPDPSFFFAGCKHKKAMSYLQYGLEQGEGFIVITGPVGTGKSTLVRNLLANIANDNIISNQIVTTNLEPEELLLLVANGFGIRYHQQNKAQLLQEIHSYLIQLSKEGKRALLIIDEAQNLPAKTIEELRMLSNFIQDEKPLLQSFLLGQEELQDTLKQENMEQFRQRIIASCHIDPLDEIETIDYIRHRLTQAGWQNSPEFCDETLRKVHRYTQGVPRKINILCDRLLLAGFLGDLDQIPVELVDETGKELIAELSHTDKTTPAIQESPTSIKSNNPISAQDHATQFRLHLEEVFDYLDRTVSTKLRLLKHLETKIEEKHDEYQELTKKIDAIKNNG